jgi:endoglucanase
MDHLASLGLNAFRLPIGWQNMVDGVVGGPLNDTALTDYYLLVSACLAVAEWCEIDVHNYARWDGEIIGQGGPTNEQFASLWSQIATKYADVPNIVFGIMNEPHDLPSITIWAGSVQAAVTAIREAGATSQYILLPGDNYTSAEQFVSGGSADALNAVTNPDGSTTGLIMDVHKYLDADNSGTTGDCVTNNIDDAFEPLATWLRANNRQAFLSESGAGNNAQCETDFCQQLAYLDANSDVYLGWTGWAAGGFAGQNYVLSEVPTLSNGVWTDTPIVTQCIVGEFIG